MARRLFPAFLDLEGRRVLVVGGGQVATEKAARLLDAGAYIVVVAPSVSPSLEALAQEVHVRPFAPSDLTGAWYVISAATSDVNAQVAAAATKRGVFVNAVDDPAAATAYAGSTFRRGPVTVAISTGGDAPALARLMREALEHLIGSDVEDWVSRAQKLRGDWKREGVAMAQRRDALLESLVQLHADRTDHARGGKRRQPTNGGRERGFVSLVGAGPGDPELLTRLAARRLAEADLVLYDALVSDAAISLATNAQRIFVGRRRGSEPLGQEAIIRTMIRAARRGRRVVRLKGGDPFVFGRGGEEALALAGAGVAFEVVPGVSSALAAPALASIPVTHRGVSSAVLVTSAHDPERFTSLVDGLTPGAATLVVLMGTAHLDAIANATIAAGWPPSTPAAVIWNSSHFDTSVWSGPLDRLPRARRSDEAPGTVVIGNVVAVRDAILARSARETTEVPNALVC